MKVILIRDIKKLGQAGAVVQVNDGYARNFLIPQGLAKFADRQVVKETRKQQENREARLKSGLERAKKSAKALESNVLEVKAKTDDKGHLYAGLKQSEILAKLKKSVFIPEGATLTGFNPLKSIGDHVVKVKLGEGITSQTTVRIVKE